MSDNLMFVKALNFKFRKITGLLSLHSLSRLQIFTDFNTAATGLCIVFGSESKSVTNQSSINLTQKVISVSQVIESTGDTAEISSVELSEIKE